MNIVLLGATGSIGESTLKVLRRHRDRLKLVGIAANSNSEKLAAIAHEFGTQHVALFDDDAAKSAKSAGIFAAGTQIHSGLDGLRALATLPDADTVLVAVVGTHGLLPALDAIEARKTLAVASKEILVLAGKFIMAAAARSGSAILPVDSEHNAIFQCLHPGSRDVPVGTQKHRHLEKLILTASGGSFRDLPVSQLADVTVEQALQHPNWDMGPKVTIDAATMANKGLEMIEARWLFDARPEQLEALIHPQSIVHSMVQFVDGSVLAQLCPPDMTFAIQHALLYPERAGGTLEPLDFSEALQLDFRPPDPARYPCFQLARRALEAGGVASGVFNAANEIAVDAFVNRRIPYTQIPVVIERTLDALDNPDPKTLDEVLHYDQQARQKATEALPRTS